jgi:polyferredoxin
MARRKTSIPVWLRRLSQTAFMLLFLYLFLQAIYMPVNRTGKGIKLFFELDPLVLVSTWIGTHQIASGLALSLVTLGVTLLAGRWFCGWVCPFGALHNLFTSWSKATAKHRIAVGGYSVWQKSKYYILAAVLVGAAFGLNLAGWLDPFSAFYRSLAVVLFPAANDTTKGAFTWLYQVDPAVGKFHVTAVSEPIYEVLRRHVLAAAQPHYYGTVLIALLFVGVVFLNLYRNRFWCRYVCPLGALLGITGKNPLVRLTRNEDACNNCGLCTVDCQGGANPAAANAWKPSECFYCLNCESACPHDVITLSVGPAQEDRK